MVTRQGKKERGENTYARKEIAKVIEVECITT